MRMPKQLELRLMRTAIDGDEDRRGGQLRPRFQRNNAGLFGSGDGEASFRFELELASLRVLVKPAHWWN